MVFVTLLALASVESAAQAETCDPRPLRARLEREAHLISLWRWGWAIGFGAASAVQGVAAVFVDDPTQREVLTASAVKAGIGFGARLILPIRVDIPAETGDGCADVIALRAAIATTGRRERNNFWLNHIGGFLVNMSGVAWLTYRANWKAGALSFAIGYPVGLASTYTMPRGLWHVWRDGDATLAGYSTSF